MERMAGTVSSSGPFGSASTFMSASSGRRSSTGSSRRSVLSSTRDMAHAATRGLVIEARRQIVSAAMAVPEPTPSKANVPAAAIWTSPRRATTATAPGTSPASTWRSSASRTRPTRVEEKPLLLTFPSPTSARRLQDPAASSLAEVTASENDGASTPYVGSSLDHELQLGDLLIQGETVALHCR